MKRVIYLTYRDPVVEGDGGNHRSYQLQQDLLSVYGDDCYVLPITSVKRALKDQSNSLINRGIYRVQNSITKRYQAFRENPYSLFVKTRYKTRQYSDPRRLTYYRNILETEKPTLCVVDHTGFLDFIDLNRRYGLQTILCPQNFDALDRSIPTSKARYLQATMLDFSNELSVLRDCDYRLFISKTEVFFVNGMNIPASYYPYLPVGDVQSTLLRLRERRGAGQQEKGLFLLLGSATHAPTGEGMKWFLQQLEQHGLPEGVRLIFAGKGTDTLDPEGKWNGKIQFLGRIEQSLLDDLMVQVNGMLVPHWRGFGALTKIPEIACAGIPLVVAQHPSLAVDLPPHAVVADKKWSSWLNAIREIMAGTTFDPASYDAWQKNQPQTLIDLCRELSGVKS